MGIGDEVLFGKYGGTDIEVDGEELIIDRKNAGAQIAFGAGAHFCPGAMLARQELRSTFEIMIERMEGLQMARPLGEFTHEVRD